MKINLTFLFIASFFYVNSQADKTMYEEVSSKYVKNYNDEKYEDIFEMFTPQMKTALPLDQTKNFLGQLQTQMGKITKLSIEDQQPIVTQYKAEFSGGVLLLHMSVNDKSEIGGLLLKPYVAKKDLPELTKNTTPMGLPFNGEWDVFWGGDSPEINYHVSTPSQKGAFDIVIRDESGKSFENSGEVNEDYYVFGKDIIAPCDGEVMLVVDGIKDNIPGEMNPIYVPGNTVIIKTANKEFLFFAHFKKQSIVVKEGQKVKRGELLGLCGNSGNSSEPHLHFHIQNVENINVATGAKCYFDKIMVNGELKENYSPVQGEKISNPK